MAKTSIGNIKARKTTAKTSLRPAKNDGLGYKDFLPVAILVVVTWICFSNAFNNDFTNWDDPGYVLNNPFISNLGFENLKNIFSNYFMSNYHPLAMLSLAVDFHFYQLDPHGYHTTNILIHLLNVSLVFVFIRLLTGKVMVAFITALLFAIHPMHVESVSWISERKDVLYVFFYLASLCIYVAYVQSEKIKKRLLFLTWILFFLSLLSKAQAVTLPVVMLLIDYFYQRTFSRKVILEKVPFLAASIIFGIVAVMAQKEAGSIQDSRLFSFPERLLFASYAFLSYSIKMFWPLNLSAHYPYPVKENDGYPAIYYWSPVLVLVLGIVFLIVRFFRNKRELMFGMLFYAANIFLLLQLLPFGGAIISERYTYLCYVGLSFAIGTSFYNTWISKNRNVSKYKHAFAFLLVIFSGYLGYKTFERNKVWKDSEQLWTDALQHDPNSVIAQINRGNYFQKQGKLDLALADFEEALRLKPDHVQALVNRANVYRLKGQYDQSVIDCNRAIEINKNTYVAYVNRGIAYCFLGKYDDALNDFNTVIENDPLNPDVYNNRGNIYTMQGKLDSAVADYSKAVQIQPYSGMAFFSRGKAYLEMKNDRAAIDDFDKAISLKVENPDVYFFRSLAHKENNDFEKALNDAQTARQMGKQFDDAYLDELVQLLKR